MLQVMATHLQLQVNFSAWHKGDFMKITGVLSGKAEMLIRTEGLFKIGQGQSIGNEKI